MITTCSSQFTHLSFSLHSLSPPNCSGLSLSLPTEKRGISQLWRGKHNRNMEAAARGGGGGPKREKAKVGGPNHEPNAVAQEPEAVAITPTTNISTCPRGEGGGGEEEEEEQEEQELLRLQLRRGLAAAAAAKANAAARGLRKAGPGTPSPSWKLEPSPPEVAPEAPAPARRSSSAASARQLGASLWEIQDMIQVGGGGGAARRIRRRRGRGLAGGGGGRDGAGGDDGGELDRPQSSGGFSRHLAASLMEHHKLHEERSHALQPFSPASYSSSIGAATVNQAISPAHSLDIKGRSREARYSLKTSTELLKVLNRIWSLEEQHTANVSVVKGLKMELQQAQARIQELTQERRGYCHEVDSLMRQVSEDKMVRKNKEQEKVKAALHSMQDELEDERRLRRHSEGLHRKLGKELCELKSAFLKAVKDLEKEKKANRLLEDLCDEFAKGIRNYEEEVRVLKQRHVKDYEHKFDKLVLHISEAWLDERMQMQNADARGALAEKTTITERLSSEIQAFLHARRSGSSKNNNIYMNDGKRDASLRRQSLESVHLNGAASAPQLADDDDDDDSVASDLHCFELNMHGGGIQNHDHTGPCRSGTGSKDAPRSRLEYSHSRATEGSYISHVPIGSQKDKTRSCSSKLQLVDRTREISLHDGAGITAADGHNETVMAHSSQGFHENSLKNNLEAPHAAYPGQESHDHFSRTSQFCEGNTSGDLCNLRSPVRQLNFQRTSSEREISECSPKLPPGVKENTLKAKLLQARLEGRHARLRASGGSSTGTARK